MADPVIVPCPVGAWTKVATNVTTGVIHILKTDPDAYFQTYRVTAGAAPTLDSEAVPFKDSLQISASAGIDVYVWCKGVAGSVRADL
jgi:hypothetical protein